MTVSSYWATPKWKSGSWYQVPAASGATTTYATVLDRQIFLPFLVANVVKVKGLGVEVAVAQGAASTAQLSLYKNAGVDEPRPGKLIVTATSTINTNSATAQSLAIADTVDGVSQAYTRLKPGLYWVSIVVGTAAGTATLRATTGYQPQIQIPAGATATAIGSLTLNSFPSHLYQASITTPADVATTTSLTSGFGATPNVFVQLV